MAFTPSSSSAAPDPHASMSPPQKTLFPAYYPDLDDFPPLKPVYPPQVIKMPVQPSPDDSNAAKDVRISEMLARLKVSGRQIPEAEAGEHVPTGNDKSRISIPNRVTAPPNLPVAPEPLVNLNDRDFISYLPSTKTTLKDLQVLWPARVEVSSAGLREILQKNEALEKELSEIRPQLKRLKGEAENYMCLSDDYVFLQQAFDNSKNDNKQLQENYNKLQDDHRCVLMHSKAKTDVLVEVTAELYELQKVKNAAVDNATSNNGCGGWDAGDVAPTGTWEAESDANGNGLRAQDRSKANGSGWGAQAGGNANGDDWGVQGGAKANGDDWGIGEGAEYDDWGSRQEDAGDLSRWNAASMAGDDWSTGHGSFERSGDDINNQIGNGVGWIQSHTIDCKRFR
ncbi:hypothetical protein LTR84_006936 [Exophiala bonariae]|uniref:VPS37 C-terminal domain-containing protein n=1 Tax=Exophiala bonariae TaxID=1690606 RepID=A0AAV9N2K3_9EURO|nr:hypothetical protein LTR84_006936 [Exophiala bonariae]